MGDTCYSYEEDRMTYNPDGKAIIARDNEVSALRHTDPEKAYFNCHTDITIPYAELAEVTAVCADGTRIGLIKDGFFRTGRHGRIKFAAVSGINILQFTRAVQEAALQFTRAIRKIASSMLSAALQLLFAHRVALLRTFRAQILMRAWNLCTESCEEL